MSQQPHDARAAKQIRPTFLVNEMVTDFFVYMTNSDYIIDSDSVVSGDLYFKYSFEYGDWDQRDWIEYLESSYHHGSALPASVVRLDTVRTI